MATDSKVSETSSSGERRCTRSCSAASTSSSGTTTGSRSWSTSCCSRARPCSRSTSDGASSTNERASSPASSARSTRCCCDTSRASTSRPSSRSSSPCMVWCTIRFYFDRSVRNGVLVGVVAGLATLTKAVILLYPGGVHRCLASGDSSSEATRRGDDRPLAILRRDRAGDDRGDRAVDDPQLRDHGPLRVGVVGHERRVLARDDLQPERVHHSARSRPTRRPRTRATPYFERLARDAGTVWERDDYETDQILNKEAKRVLREEPLQVARKSVVGLVTFWYQLTSLKNSMLGPRLRHRRVGARNHRLAASSPRAAVGLATAAAGVLPEHPARAVAGARAVLGADLAGLARGLGVRRRHPHRTVAPTCVPDVMIRGDEIRAVLLDLDGTLYRQGPVRRAMVARLARAHWRQPSVGRPRDPRPRRLSAGPGVAARRGVRG